MNGGRPPGSRGPWRNPYENRPPVTVRRGDRGLYEVTVSPGAGAADLTDAVSALPSVAYVDHRPAAPGDPAAILVFRAVPDGVPLRPPPVGGPLLAWVAAIPAAAVLPVPA